MSTRVLSQDVVSLVHHVELAAAGWRDRLCEQLVIAKVADGHRPQVIADVIEEIASELGRTLSTGALAAACERLIGRGVLIRNVTGETLLSQAALEDVRQRREASAALEQQAKSSFLKLASELCPEVARDDLWTRFTSGCLEPTVAELGARTYQFMAQASDSLGAVRSMAAFVERFPQEGQAAIKRLIDTFLDPSDRVVRDYVLQQLNAHFLGLAASLSDEALSSLTSRLRNPVKLRFFLDTNFLFSVLDLHDNPANDAAKELISLLKRLHGRLDYKLYVYPLTLDEMRRTLGAYEHTLAATYLTPKLGRAALGARTGLSGLVLRYLRAVAEASGRLTAHDFLDPYLSDPVSVLRAKGVEIYNASIDGLTTSQPVIDDIVDQQMFEAHRYPDWAKPYEALRHDIALWHLVKGRRGSGLESPLDAVYWIVTIDYRFLGFDAHKMKGDATPLSLCVHPAVLLQMLQLWLPRDETVDRALIHGIRSLLPQVFDAQAEQATVRILTTLARYENVDDLDENTITEVLMNKALGDRIRMVDDVRKQIDLVRDALVAQFAQVKTHLAAETQRASALEGALAHQQALLAAATKRHGAEYDAMVAERQRLQESLGRESKERDELTSRVTTLEETLRRTSESYTAMLDDQQQRRHLVVFLIGAAVGAAGAVVGGIMLPRVLIEMTQMSLRRATLIAWTGTTGVVGLGIWVTGLALPTVRTSPWFHRLQAVMKWVLGTVWAVFLGIVSTYLWERY
jgi:hypothetical protein